MRFVRVLAAMAAMVCSAVAPSAQAAKFLTVTGTVTPDSSGLGWLKFSPGLPTTGSPFTWGAVARFSAPVTGFIEIISKDAKFYRSDKDGNLVNSNDFGDQSIFISFTGSNAGTGSVGFPVLHYPNGDSEGFVLEAPTGQITLTGLSAPVIYRIGIFSAAPEPAAWALMILGMGAVGSVLRRRTASGIGARYQPQRAA